ncbi:MAG: protease modulator HflC [Chthoniobacteraceae bacterium]
MQAAARSLLILIGFIAILAITGAFYVIPETEQVLITQFGKPVGAPITTAGLKFKVPFIQEVNRIDKRVLPWDGPSAEMPTKDKLYINVDAFGRWQITDALTYFRRFTDERAAQSRLDDILGSEMRNTIARHDLVEVIRTVKGRKAVIEAVTTGVSTGGLPPIKLGRVALEHEVFEAAKTKLAEFGIELLDVRFMRINYNGAVATKIFDRMTSERQQIADRFKSEGAGEAAKIIGEKERELRRVESEAYQKTQGITGKADAEATAIYAQAFNASPEAREFYEFLRAMEAYKTSFTTETTLVLTTDSALLRFLKTATPAPLPPPQP